ncbi:Pollen receptor-like kinase 1 [Linum perenne]
MTHYFRKCINTKNIITKSFFFFFIISLHFHGCWGLTDSEVLLKFKAALGNKNGNRLSNWRDGIDVCDGDKSNWVGVICDQGLVLGLKLESMRLTGKIDVDSLAQLEELKTLGLNNNNFKGALPNFKNLLELRSLYLSNNKFSGKIPADSFKGMIKLKKLYLSGNNFSGEIPSSLAGLSKLTTLRLENNEFTGLLPKFTAKFESFNASNNQLKGPIPRTLSKIDSSAFSGNKGLCGKPLAACRKDQAPSPSATSNSKSSVLEATNGNTFSDDLEDTSDEMPSDSKKPSTTSIVFVAIVGAVAVCGIIAAAFILLRRRQQTSESIDSSNIEPGIPDDSSHRPTTREQPKVMKKEATMKLSFVREDRGRFELHDLLKASAELLGSGCFGSSYKAALTSGQVMVVKRFKQMNNVGREEFHDHMRRIGKLRHTNLLPLVAFYYRKEEKLLVHDFVPYGSLAVHLHGVSRGLSYLYKELPSVIAAHGHLKSNNVLLDENFEPYLTDYGLIPVINQENAQELMVAYKSPEYLRLGRVTKKTDVWALGMLILEVVTGKLSSTFLKQGGGGEGGEDRWASEVVDKELREEEEEELINIHKEGEMVKLVRIGLMCCEGDVDKRPDLKEVVGMIEEINIGNDNIIKDIYDDDLFSSYNDDEQGGMRRPSRDMIKDFDYVSR